MTIRIDNQVRLPDGRQLGYAEYGDPSGRPVLFFHGIPGSRYDATWPGHDEIARDAGVRMLAVERPGMGLSDPMPERGIADWPADIAALTEALGIERFGLMAYSGGAPYLVACALAMPERVTTACLVSGAVPGLNERGEIDALPATWESLRALAKDAANLSERLESLLIMPMSGMAHWLKKDPEAYLTRHLRGFCQADKDTLAQPAARQTLIRVWQEGFRQGPAGEVHDMTIGMRQWGLDLTQVGIPVYQWQGDADVMVTLQRSRYYPKQIPDCRVTVCKGEGHFSLFANYFGQILEQIQA
jgi:pimeloyl-ACP methyl ester carboxylesterase